MIAVQRYLASVEQRFDLLDAQRPFYQAPGLPGHLAAPVGRLDEVRQTAEPAIAETDLWRAWIGLALSLIHISEPTRPY